MQIGGNRELNIEWSSQSSATMAGLFSNYDWMERSDTTVEETIGIAIRMKNEADLGEAYIRAHLNIVVGRKLH